MTATTVATIARQPGPGRMFHEVASCPRSCRVRDLLKVMTWAAANFPPRQGGSIHFLRQLLGPQATEGGGGLDQTPVIVGVAACDIPCW